MGVIIHCLIAARIPESVSFCLVVANSLPTIPTANDQYQKAVRSSHMAADPSLSVLGAVLPFLGVPTTSLTTPFPFTSALLLVVSFSSRGTKFLPPPALSTRDNGFRHTGQVPLAFLPCAYSSCLCSSLQRKVSMIHL